MVSPRGLYAQTQLNETSSAQGFTERLVCPSLISKRLLFFYIKYKQTCSYTRFNNLWCRLNKVNKLFTTSRISKITKVKKKIPSVYALFDLAE